LQWDQHINNITAKANKTLGFLRRNLKIPSIRIKEQAYQTLVRPLVEYASTVWNPYTKTEWIQRVLLDWSGGKTEIEEEEEVGGRKSL
jgi:hypothetical protein